MPNRLKEDTEAINKNDPATRGFWDAFITNPGLHALWWHRVAHFFYTHRMPLFAKVISQFARFFTNVEIHPGAEIGRRFFIDHGAGVVIGETAIIGDDVVIFHGVTLGGTGKDIGKRHPTVGDRVFISAGAKVLGPVVLGADSKIGAGAVVLKDVPPDATVVGVPAKVVRLNGRRVAHAEPDIDSLLVRVNELERKIERLLEEKERK